jgi:hypothetical protein
MAGILSYNGYFLGRMMSYFITFLYPFVWLLLSLELEATTYNQGKKNPNATTISCYLGFIPFLEGFEGGWL